MNKEMPFELPKASEKLSYKFIMDTLRDRNVAEANHQIEGADVEAAPSAPETAPTEATVSAEPEEEMICGTSAPGEIEAPPLETQPLARLSLPADKKYFRIGEVSELIGVEPYVLRYWETEFKLLKPSKSGSGHRVYSRKDVETLHQIRHLLHVEKFSIKGAKRKLLENRREPNAVPALQTDHRAEYRQWLKTVQQDLKDLLQAAKSF